MPIYLPACLRLARSCLFRRGVATRCKHILPIMATGKLKSENFDTILTDDVMRIADLIQSVKRSDTGEGHEVRLVGGAVRDLLMDRAPKDVDLATTMLPEAMFDLCESSGFRTIATGLKHGTITVVTERGQNVEITSLRVDQETDGRHATVKFTTDWQQDAARRDLTINAMSLSLEGTLYDYFSGEQDILDRRVQFVGDPMKRIREDYLRILRYFRFHGRIAKDPLVHDEITITAIRELRDGLKQVSVERVCLEMAALVTGPNAPGELHTMYDVGVAERIRLPVPGRHDEFERVWRVHHGYGGGDGAAEVKGRKLSFVSLLLALHDEETLMAAFAERWKLSRVQRALMVFVADNRSRHGDLKHYQDMLTDAQAASKAHVEEVLAYQGRTDMARAIADWPIPVMPVNGAMLKKHNIKNGPAMGAYLSTLRKLWQKSNFTLTAEDLLSNHLQN
eukprot:scpid82974/ scgid15142/ CCA tRNA nucleotidyltransferase 1, mitochondrial; mitochondrial tRNA nucleotidyl transferase, CCA-adding